MTYLLDTHTFLWGQDGDRRLGPETAALMIDPAHPVYLSMASAWEMGIKASLGRLEVPDDLEALLVASRFDVLPIRLSHTIAVRRLPHHHGDPFDRMLVAQARVEGLTLVTSDGALAAYDVPVIDARL